MTHYVKLKPAAMVLRFALLFAALVLAPTRAQPAQAQLQPAIAPSVVFVGNAGQADPAVRCMTIGGGAGLFATDEGIWLCTLAPAAAKQQPGEAAQSYATVPTARASATVKLSFTGANSRPKIEPFGQLPARVSFLIAPQRDWRAIFRRGPASVMPTLSEHRS